MWDSGGSNNGGEGMRDIKFRAWDGHKMNEDVSIIQGEAIKNGYAGTAFTAAAKAGQAMQYTGLQDKNGKDIYEGDMVYLGGYGPYLTEFPFADLYDAAAEEDIGEILGNIHENPELLNDQ